MEMQIIPEAIAITIEVGSQHPDGDNRHCWKRIWTSICTTASMLIVKLLAILKNHR